VSAARRAVDLRGATRPGAVARAVTSALRAETVRRLIAREVRVRVTVEGGSMGPLLQSGDRVVLGPLRGAPLRGDLLAVGSGDSMLVRRFVERPSPGVIFTAGDDTSRHGVPLSETAIVGVIEAIERDGRIVEREPAETTLRRLVSAARRLARRMAG